MSVMLSVQLFPLYGPNISRKISFAVKVTDDVTEQNKCKHKGESITSAIPILKGSALL